MSKMITCAANRHMNSTTNNSASHLLFLAVRSQLSLSTHHTHALDNMKYMQINKKLQGLKQTLKFHTLLEYML